MARLSLVIDTAFDTCQVGLAQNDQLIAKKTSPSGGGHDRVLAGMVRDLFVEQKISTDDLSRIIVTTGPGRFTGLRVGIAFARGLALVYETELVGVLTTDALAMDLLKKYPDEKNLAVIATVKRGESFVQTVRPALSAIQVVPDAELANTLSTSFILGGVVTSEVDEILQKSGISLAKDVVEPSLEAILTCGLQQQRGKNVVRPYYAASYAD